ncbi:tetratricopeptide repeat protein [Sphingobacterium paucimobilis]|uniref:Tetratricopeptide repeat protein n=1 Tax=Sphingobacterium paucimobilis HER1398 TaxID=1346330 RepID=U2HQC9_9SPHI|nr:tetratricopeptide repeat protein [Sphingobacterium paucimobilis]ERJ57672.1 hypothetical protein M472_02715 [Sphingobacterium paucimobilis HER1398]
MQRHIHQQAEEALLQGDYDTAAKIWIQGNALPQDLNAVSAIFQQVSTLNAESPSPNLYAILGIIALDYNEVFESDRQKALIECIQWSKNGLEIDPDNYNCNRHAGSALYWLGDRDAATKYYKKAIELAPSPVLQIRLFNIQNQHNPNPDFSMLQVDNNTKSAMEAYNAGVEINYLLEQYINMPTQEAQRLTTLKQQCYEQAYYLYKGAIIQDNGDIINDDPHTFAMCCNNLAREYRLQGAHEKAIAICNEGIEQSSFMVILQNRFGAYSDAGQLQLAIQDGELLIEEFGAEMDLLTYFATIDTICSCYMELKNYEDGLEWINLGLETYYELEPTDPISQEQEVVRCFTNFFIYKANAESGLGTHTPTEVASQETDRLLENMPDNPSLLISRANAFIEGGDYSKAMECYEYALHFATEKKQERSVQVALYNMGYLQVAYMKDNEGACDSFEGSISSGNQDFWCYYWATHCTYHLGENEKTIYYGQLALQTLNQQDNVTDDVIAEIYEHIGTSFLDLERYDESIQYLQKSLNYNDTPTTRENLKTAEATKQGSKGFFGKLFGK